MYSYPSIAIVQSFSPTAALHPRYRHPAASFHVRDGGTSPLPPPDPHHHIRPSQRRIRPPPLEIHTLRPQRLSPHLDPQCHPLPYNHTKWEGVVICFNGRIWGLHLVDMGFTARLQLSPLVNLHGLRTLSILRNDLKGPMPDLSRLGALKAVYFSNNSFSEKIHDMTLRSPECAPLKSFYAAEDMKNIELGELQRPSDAASAPEEKNGGMENVDDVLGRLTFMRKGREIFDLHELLRASAEMLGSVNFGASYKAALSTGPTVVVKKFKEMNAVDMEDFTEHMWRLGRLSHPNILPLLAYYYKNRAELLVFDFVANGSLAHLLHGKRGSVMPPLDWPTRLKIVKGVARGLACLYNELPVLSLPHGHLKSSNVLLNETFEPLLTDYTVVPVVNAASQLMVAYKSPEANEFGRPSNKSDVWSLGILILEILTRKYPGNFLQKRTTAQSWQHGWAW